MTLAMEIMRILLLPTLFVVCRSVIAFPVSNKQFYQTIYDTNQRRFGPIVLVLMDNLYDNKFTFDGMKSDFNSILKSVLANPNIAKLNTDGELSLPEQLQKLIPLGIIYKRIEDRVASSELKSFAASLRSPMNLDINTNLPDVGEILNSKINLKDLYLSHRNNYVAKSYVGLSGLLPYKIVNVNDIVALNRHLDSHEAFLISKRINENERNDLKRITIFKNMNALDKSLSKTGENQEKLVDINLRKLNDKGFDAREQFNNGHFMKRDLRAENSLRKEITNDLRNVIMSPEEDDRRENQLLGRLADLLPPIDLNLGVHSG